MTLALVGRFVPARETVMRRSGKIMILMNGYMSHQIFANRYVHAREIVIRKNGKFITLANGSMKHKIRAGRYGRVY